MINVDENDDILLNLIKTKTINNVFIFNKYLDVLKINNLNTIKHITYYENNTHLFGIVHISSITDIYEYSNILQYRNSDCLDEETVALLKSKMIGAIPTVIS